MKKTDKGWISIVATLNGCEVRGAKCLHNQFLTPAHRHNRVAYKKKPEMLWSYSQVIVACVKCHEWIDANKKRKEEIFQKLRGEDELKR